MSPGLIVSEAFWMLDHAQSIELSTKFKFFFPLHESLPSGRTQNKFESPSRLAWTGSKNDRAINKVKAVNNSCLMIPFPLSTLPSMNDHF
ncbi:MAG: hypothetical protein ACXAAT_15830 [Candidatus Hodarchaeales archaeon]